MYLVILALYRWIWKRSIEAEARDKKLWPQQKYILVKNSSQPRSLPTVQSEEIRGWGKRFGLEAKNVFPSFTQEFGPFARRRALRFDHERLDVNHRGHGRRLAPTEWPDLVSFVLYKFHQIWWQKSLSLVILIRTRGTRGPNTRPPSRPRWGGRGDSRSLSEKQKKIQFNQNFLTIMACL